MVAFTEIIERIKDIISEQKTGSKVYDKNVAKELGISQATFATMKKRKSIPYKEIMEFCAKKKISINWIFFDQPVQLLTKQTDRLVNIRYFSDIKASAGGGAEVENEEFEYLALDGSMLDIVARSTSLKELEALRVEGESMEPTIEDGSVVFVDRSQTDISKDGIYVASTTAGLFIKRMRLRADGNVELISDNKIYSAELLPAQEVRIVGKVVGSISRV